MITYLKDYMNKHFIPLGKNGNTKYLTMENKIALLYQKNIDAILDLLNTTFFLNDNYVNAQKIIAEYLLEI